MHAFLDTCVLFPTYLRDTLLDAATAGICVPRWSDEVLVELRRNLVEHGRTDENRADRLVSAMRAVFPEAEVRNYQALIPRMTNHPKDRHVLAAAVWTRAETIVTSNLVDFPQPALQPWSMDVASPDVFLRPLFDEAEERMVLVIERQAARYRAPTLSVSDLLDRLAVHAPTVLRRYAKAYLAM